MGFSRQECWSGLPFPFPGHLPDAGIKPRSPTLQVNYLPSEPPSKPHYPCEHSNNYSLDHLNKIDKTFESQLPPSYLTFLHNLSVE